MATKRKRWPKRLPYKEGDFFALPLESGGWGVGLLARIDGTGGILCYMFGPRRHAIPALDELTTLRPEDAVEVARAGDLGFLEQEWKVIGAMPGWSRADWPVPRFGRTDRITPSIAHITEFADDLTRIREITCTPADITGLPHDSLYGYKALEIAMDKRLPP